jgi:predicted glycosyltransferase
VGKFVRDHRQALRLRSTRNNRLSCAAIDASRKKIWIDLENTPHVPFFKPIIRELEKRGYAVVVTAREAFQVCELARQQGLKFTQIGRHYGKNKLLKVWGLFRRGLQLLPFLMREKPVLGLNHGARAQIFLCNLMRIPTVMIMDYEHTAAPPMVRPRWEVVPQVMLKESLHCRAAERIRAYHGIKEDVYAPEFQPDPSILTGLNLAGDDLIVTVRPPATEAHYHNPESQSFFVEFMNRVCDTSGVRVVLLPRNKNQENELRREWPRWFEDSKVIVPPKAVDGLNLLWHSDLAVSGGGTMNREAAALGVPVYSVFRGKIGAVDRQLQKEGRLTLIERLEDVQEKILLRSRKKDWVPASTGRTALHEIVDHIEEIIRLEHLC